METIDIKKLKRNPTDLTKFITFAAKNIQAHLVNIKAGTDVNRNSEMLEAETQQLIKRFTEELTSLQNENNLLANFAIYAPYYQKNKDLESKLRVAETTLETRNLQLRVAEPALDKCKIQLKASQSDFVKFISWEVIFVSLALKIIEVSAKQALIGVEDDYGNAMDADTIVNNIQENLKTFLIYKHLGKSYLDTFTKQSEKFETKTHVTEFINAISEPDSLHIGEALQKYVNNGVVETQAFWKECITEFEKVPHAS